VETKDIVSTTYAITTRRRTTLIKPFCALHFSLSAAWGNDIRSDIPFVYMNAIFFSMPRTAYFDALKKVNLDLPARHLASIAYTCRRHLQEVGVYNVPSLPQSFRGLIHTYGSSHPS